MGLTTPMKIVLAVIIIAIIGLGFWILDWQKKQNTLAGIQKQLEDKKAELSRIQKDVQQIDQLVQTNTQLKQTVKDIVASGMTPETEANFVPNYLTQVENLVETVGREENDSSFQILSITPGAQTTSSVGGGGKEAKPGGKGAAPSTTAPAPEALKNYPTRTFQMSMNGRYETLVYFLDQLGRLKLKRLVTVNKLTLSPSGGVKSGSPVLAITLPLTAYMRTNQGGTQ